MTELIIYIGKVALIQVCLILGYQFVFKRTNWHSLNRIFLLGSICVSFIIPFIELSGSNFENDWEQYGVIEWVEQSVEQYELIPVDEKSSDKRVGSLFQLIPVIYFSIVVLFISRSVIYLIYLQRLKRDSQFVDKKWYKLFKTTHNRSFSFFSNVFISQELFGTKNYEKILAHECVHVRMHHTIDRLFIEFLVSLFWFNPVIYWYRNALIETHEFQADEAVINQFKDPLAYQEVLYEVLHNATYSGLVSHFNFSMIKKRIVMMNKEKSKHGKLAYLAVVPILIAIIFAFSSKTTINSIEHVSSELVEMIAPEPSLTFDFLESEQQEKSIQKGFDNSIPSILPLKEVEYVRMTSGFGNRMDPLDRVSKHHRGIDFATPIGNEVLATADGQVVFAGHNGRYGNQVRISHGESFITAYAHLHSVQVSEGDFIKKGEVIALSGNTGASTAPHLHYEISKDGSFVNPASFIKNYEFKRKDKGKQKNKLKSKDKDKGKKKPLRVLIDPGHGGSDAGAISSTGKKEKNISLMVAKIIASEFASEKKIKVQLTRESDKNVSLNDRVEMTKQADLFISLHIANHVEEGSFVFPIYDANSVFAEDSHEFALLLVEEFQAIGKEARYGYVDSYKVLRDAQCPAVLFRFGYFSDPEEVEYLSSPNGQKQVALQIAQAIRRSLSES